MFLPLHDRNHLRHIRFQGVTLVLVATNCLVFLTELAVLPATSESMMLNAGMTPSALLAHHMVDSSYLALPPWLTLFTYTFLHDGWLHLLGNLLFLWVFGDNVEDAMGHFRFLIFYLLCGAVAGLTHAALNPMSDNPLIGASGAIAGIFGGYLMLYPRVRVWVFLFPIRIPLPLPIIWLVIAWLGFQFFFIFTQMDMATGWWAHIGGFLTGAFLVVFLRRSDVPLLGPRPEENLTPTAGPAKE